MLPIILISTAAAFLVSCHSNSNASLPHPDSGTPPSTPPPPPPGGITALRGINPALFRRSAQEVNTELTELFGRAYRFNADSGDMSLANGVAQTQLRQRLDQLRLITLNDSWAAREYDRPEISRFFYFSEGNSESTLFATIDRDATNEALVQAMRDLAGRLIQNAENPTSHPFENNWLFNDFFLGSLRRVLGEERLNPLIRQVAVEVLQRSPLIEESSWRTILNSASQQELLQLYRFLQNHFQAGQFALPATEAPSLLQRLRQATPPLSSENQNELRHIAHYIPLLLSSRGVSPLRFYEDVVSVPSGSLNSETLEMSRVYSLASLSLDPLDNATARHRFQEMLESYVTQYPSLNTQARISDDSLRRGQYLYSLFSNPDFGTPLTEVEWNQISRRTLPALPTILSLEGNSTVNSQMLLRLRTPQTRIEFTPDQMPTEWQVLATSVQVAPGVSLFGFIRERLNRIILRGLPNSELEAPRLNPVTRTLEIPFNIDKSSAFDLLSVIAGEAYQLYLSDRASTLDENIRGIDLAFRRNNKIFRIQVQRQMLQTVLSAGSISLEAIRSSLFELAIARLLVRVMNRGIGYPEEDSQIRLSLPAGVRPAQINSDLNQLFSDYVRTSGVSWEKLADREYLQLIRELSPTPQPAASPQLTLPQRRNPSSQAPRRARG